MISDYSSIQRDAEPGLVCAVFPRGVFGAYDVASRATVTAEPLWEQRAYCSCA
jgi:hypothetical protein